MFNFITLLSSTSGLAESLQGIVDFVNNIIWNYFLMYALVAVGIFLTIYLGFPQISKIGKGFKQVFGGLFSREKSEKGSMSSFQALATAIAAQIGTGNVVGVSTAILAGGPGAIFWMWVSSLFGMGTIFVEAVLAQVYRERRDGELVGGPAYYITKGTKSKFLGSFFAVAIILALGFMGNAVQSNSIATNVHILTGIPTWIIGVVVAVLAASVFVGGVDRIKQFAELIVPIMAVIYIIASVSIMILFASELGNVFKLIFSTAFTGQAAIGGFVGATMKIAIQKGVARGLFSNEAGMGSTPHAHAVAMVKHPVEQGMTAMVGVFIDTILVCTGTAVAVLATQAYMVPGVQGSTLTQEAFGLAFGNPGTIVLVTCLSFFAFTTIIGWYYFGESNIKFLFGRKGLTPYRVIVFICIILGSLGESALVWEMADMFNGIMVIPNIIALVLLAKVVKDTLKDYDTQVSKGLAITYDYKED